MHLQFSPYITPLPITGLVTAALACYAWRRRGLPGATPLVVFLASIALWAAGNSLEMASTDLATKSFWANFQYFSLAAIPLAWLAVAIEYTGSETWMTWRRLALFSVIPAITLAMVWTNDLHELMRHDLRLDDSGPFSVIAKTYGPWFWVHTAYSYALILVAAVLLIMMLGRTHGPHRLQPVALLVSMLLPMASSLAYLLGVRWGYPMDLTPVVLGLSGMIVAWAIFKYGLLNIVPVAHDKIIEWTADGVIVLDAQGKVVNVNPAAERILGMPSDRAVGRLADRLFQLWPELAALSITTETARVDLTVGGEEQPRHYEVFAASLTDSRMRPVGRTITLHDTTRQKVADMALRESEEKHQQIADTLPIALYEADLSGRLTYGNRSGVKLFGYEWEEFEQGLNIFHLIAPEDRERAARNMAEIIAGQPTQLREYVALRKGGERFPVMVSATPVMRNGLAVALRGFVLDILPRKLAEEAVRSSEERYRTLAEAAQDVIFITDLDGILQYVNSYAARCRSCEPEDLVGKPLSALIPWDTAEQQVQAIRRVAESASPTYFEHQGAIGTRDAWLYTCLAPLRNDQGRVVSVLGLSRDTTELARMRDELRALSLVDELTGLHNRRGFLALATQQSRLAERNGQDVTILLADFDGLKRINDTFGHEEGNRALTSIAGILREACRESDVVARLGGDEFAVLAVDAGMPSAESLVRRILAAVEAENALNSRPYKLSVSLGVAHGRITSVDSVERLLAHSDSLMYQEKRSKHAPDSSAEPLVSPIAP